jgi:RNA polymerase sigma factor (sigma-70 family)
MSVGLISGAVPPVGGPATLEFEQFFQKYREGVLRFCLARTRDPYLAEDLVQEVFIRVYNNLDKLEGDPRSWLLQVARNLCTDHFRRNRGDLQRELDEGAEAVVDDPERHVMASYGLAALLGCLTSTERRVVTEKWILDRSHQDTGATMGITAGTTRALLSRARKRMAKYLEDERAAIGGWLLGVFDTVSRRATRQGEHTILRLAFPLAGLAGVCMVAGSPTPIGRGGAGQAAAVAHAGVVADAPSPASSLTAIAPISQPTAVVRSVLRPYVAPGAAAPGLLQLGHESRPQDTEVTDMEASPNFNRDHTVVMAGTDMACATPPCHVLFVSHDGAYSWGRAQAQQFASTQLLLPFGAFDSTRFFAFGSQGIQMTKDGGRSFRDAAPFSLGYAAVDTLSPSAMLYSDTSIWTMTADSTAPTMVAVLPPGSVAAGPPLRESEGGTLLEPVVLPGSIGPSLVRIVRCLVSCYEVGTLPWGGSARLQDLRVGPQRVLLASSRGAIALSRDGGATWDMVPGPSGSNLDAIGIANGNTLRLVVTVPRHAAASVFYSDNAGRSWTVARGPAEWTLSELRVAGDSLLMAPGDPTRPGDGHTFFCSNDLAATWTNCPRL